MKYAWKWNQLQTPNFIIIKKKQTLLEGRVNCDVGRYILINLVELQVPIVSTYLKINIDVGTYFQTESYNTKVYVFVGILYMFVKKGIPRYLLCLFVQNVLVIAKQSKGQAIQTAFIIHHAVTAAAFLILIKKQTSFPFPITHSSCPSKANKKVH